MKFMLCAIIVIFLLHETVGSWFDFEVLVSLLTCFNVAFGCSDCTKCKRFFHFASLLALTLWCLGGFGDFRKKNSSFRLPYQRPSSSADCARELFNGSNGSASLVDCTQKIFLVEGGGLFVSDVISEVVLGSFWLMLPGLGPNH